MNQNRVLQGVLVLWGIWTILNGLLSAFAPQVGANLVGWAPAEGWTPGLVAMTQQYGMVLLLLGAVYLITATDPVRYQRFIWIVIAEQIIGILFSALAAFGQGQITTGQFVTQAIINLVVMSLLLVLRPSDKSDLGHTASTSST